MSNTLEKIKSRINKLEELNAIQRHYEMTKEELLNEEQNLKMLEKKLDSELKDIEKLEGLSVKSLFHKVLGSKEEQLEKEKQEYLQVSLKYKEHVKGIELLEYELNLLGKKVADVSVLQREIEHLKGIREKEIMASHSHLRNVLVDIYHKVDSGNQRLAEYQQAYDAGKGAMASVQRVADHLRQAKKWGDWDQMSKARHYDRRKHTEIDRAIDQAYQAKHQLKIFANELRDVGINIGQLDIQIDSLGGFLDVLFDNLITDWVVQNKIKNALRNAESTYDRIHRLVKNLEADMNNEQSIITGILEEKDRLLIA